MVETALQIVDEGGADALSMRSLAQRLNSSTATLYRHFPNRAALIDAVIDRVIGEIDVHAEEIRAGTWEQACRRIANDYFAALNRHTGVALLLSDRSPVGPNGAMVRERWLEAMLRNGFPVDVAVRSGALISSYVQGFGIQLGGQRAVAGLDEELLPAAAQMLDQAGFPATAIALRAGVIPVSLEDEFAFGLDLILNGLAGALDASRD
jgi:TetR/AcrR family tetracycline transcriptional repressor